MVPLKTFAFPGQARLKKRRQFLAVQQAGHKVTSRFFIALLLKNQLGGPARLGVTVTTRYGNAVARNRVKRLVREAFRCGRLMVPAGMDVVVIPKKHAKHISNGEVFLDLDHLGRAILRHVESLPL